MRTASRVFLAIGSFGLIAGLLFASAGRLHRGNVQGPFILMVFAIACMFLALHLSRQGSVELDGLTLPGADAHADEEIHLPGPSWYPAFYGVACLVLVLGLVFHRAVLIAGGVLV